MVSSHLLSKKKDVLVDGSQSKPADIYIPIWSYGKPLAIDVTGASSCTFEKDVTAPLMKAANMKNEKFLKRCNDSGIILKTYLIW